MFAVDELEGVQQVCTGNRGLGYALDHVGFFLFKVEFLGRRGLVLLFCGGFDNVADGVVGGGC